MSLSHFDPLVNFRVFEDALTRPSQSYNHLIRHYKCAIRAVRL